MRIPRGRPERPPIPPSRVTAALLPLPEGPLLRIVQASDMWGLLLPRPGHMGRFVFIAASGRTPGQRERASRRPESHLRNPAPGLQRAGPSTAVGGFPGTCGAFALLPCFHAACRSSLGIHLHAEDGACCPAVAPRCHHSMGDVEGRKGEVEHRQQQKKAQAFAPMPGQPRTSSRSRSRGSGCAREAELEGEARGTAERTLLRVLLLQPCPPGS
jgi:hypothetical protein